MSRHSLNPCCTSTKTSKILPEIWSKYRKGQTNTTQVRQIVSQGNPTEDDYGSDDSSDAYDGYEYMTIIADFDIPETKSELQAVQISDDSSHNSYDISLEPFARDLEPTEDSQDNLGAYDWSDYYEPFGEYAFDETYDWSILWSSQHFCSPTRVTHLSHTVWVIDAFSLRINDSQICAIKKVSKLSKLIKIFVGENIFQNWKIFFKIIYNSYSITRVGEIKGGLAHKLLYYELLENNWKIYFPNKIRL